MVLGPLALRLAVLVAGAGHHRRVRPHRAVGAVAVLVPTCGAIGRWLDHRRQH